MNTFYLWIVIVCICIPLGAFLTCGFLGDFDFFGTIKSYLLPGMIAAILSVLFRFQQFFMAIHDGNINSIKLSL